LQQKGRGGAASRVRRGLAEESRECKFRGEPEGRSEKRQEFCRRSEAGGILHKGRRSVILREGGFKDGGGR